MYSMLKQFIIIIIIIFFIISNLIWHVIFIHVLRVYNNMHNRFRPSHIWGVIVLNAEWITGRGSVIDLIINYIIFDSTKCLFNGVKIRAIRGRKISKIPSSFSNWASTHTLCLNRRGNQQYNYIVVHKILSVAK